MKRFLLWVGIFVLALTLWLRPHGLAVYHLEVGGRALDEALGSIEPLRWWYVGPRNVQNPQALQKAIAHLQQAGSLSHSWRLLGRAWMAQGSVLQSVEALERFAVSRPENPMGHLELAAAYELVDQTLREMEYVNLLDALPGARVSTPGRGGETNYQAEGWEDEHMYPTVFSLPPNYGERPTLFLHAGSRVSYTVTLTQAAVLRFGMALDPRSLDWGGDGATFEVFVNGRRVFLEHLPVEVAREGWHRREVDLSDYSGQTISVTLETTPGPIGDVTADWAGWGEPRIEAAEAAIYRHEVEGKPWLSEWQKSGLSAWDFIRAGEEARKAKQYDEALRWYKWAQNVGALSAPFYQSFTEGLLFEEQALWSQAISSFGNAIEMSSEDGVFPGTVHYRIGLLQQNSLSQWEAAFESYGNALASGRFVTDMDRADAHYRRGVILMYGQKDMRRASQEFQSAVKALPNHYGALLELGGSYWELDRDFKKAEQTLQKATEANPQAHWAYIALGDLYRGVDMLDEASAMYKRALELAPSSEGIRQRIQEIEQEPSK